ncbi:MAG: hypothetical protein E7165_04115 [Firmicutes bacterium]|nr:hypothetical protein [Bacillota bacterium]
MSNTEFIYHGQTLYVNLNGKYKSKNIKILKSKIYSIIDQYGINDIIIDKKLTTEIDNVAFYEMLDEYDIKYGGNLIVEE